jgi:hypothetical protein
MKKLLFNESGYVLVLQRPHFVLDGEIQEKELSSGLSVREVGVVIQTPTCSVPHCCFYCAWCGHPVLLPNDRIGSPFGNPDARKIDVRSIATVCLHCKHIGNYSMFRSCRGYDTRHKITHSPNRGTTALLNWLQCVESTCTARVPLFVNIEDGAGPEEFQTAEWLWDELTCALGHRINQIPLDPTSQLPLRSSIGTR